MKLESIFVLLIQAERTICSLIVITELSKTKLTRSGSLSGEKRFSLGGKSEDKANSAGVCDVQLEDK